MGQIYNTHEGKGQSPTKVQGQLEKLREDLLTKRQTSVESGFVGDIHMIDAALGQVEKALEEVKLNQKIANSQARLGQVRSSGTTEEADEEIDPETITEYEAEQIMAIRSVQGEAIQPGQVFASMYGGREPSNVAYMQKNINGLFDLVALKNSK